MEPINPRFHRPTVGKTAGKKSQRTSQHDGPQDRLVSSSGRSHEGGDIKGLRDAQRRNRRTENFRHIDNKASAHVAGAGSFMGTIGTMSLKYPDGRWDLKALATSALERNGLETGYPQDVMDQVAEIVARVRPSEGVYNHPPDASNPWVRDYTDKPLVSIDNGTLWTEMDPEVLAKDPEANVSSRDIDQLQMAKKLENGDIRVTVAVSDVDAFVPKDSPLDRFMDKNTSSIYTPDKVFNLIPPELAEDIVSLNPREERLATVVEYTVTPDGEIKDGDVFQAIVKSQTKLDYSSVGAWLEGRAEASPAMNAQGPDLLEGLKVQAEASARMEKAQDRKGALEFDRTETRIITENGNAVGFEESKKNTATELVENFMVNTNSVMSQFLRGKGYPTLERVVTPPEKWDQIQALAKTQGFKLPNKPDAKALSNFLAEAKQKDPEGSGELSISVIKLIGRGVYQAVAPNEETPGHFPLGVKNYMQSTASIRRGGDRISPRMLKAALAGKDSPYTPRELSSFADNLNSKGRNLNKGERLAEKMVAATMLEDKVGERFDAVVTGVKDGRAFCRIGNPPVEGKLNAQGKVEVGDKLSVKLSRLDVEKGWIDFQQISRR
jgi:exoribonuclease R